MSKASTTHPFSAKRRKLFSMAMIYADIPLRQSMVAEIREQDRIDIEEYMTPAEYLRGPLTQPHVVFVEMRPTGMKVHEFLEQLVAHDVAVVLIASNLDVARAVAVMNQFHDRLHIEMLVKPLLSEQILEATSRAYAAHYELTTPEDRALEDSLLGMDLLTKRERVVLEMVLTGTPSRQIGDELGISTKTVEAHRARINDKLRSKDVGHLIRIWQYHQRQLSEASA